MTQLIQLSLNNNVIRLDNITDSVIELCNKYGVTNIITQLMEKLRNNHITKGTFYKINGTWYGYFELTQQAFDFMQAVNNAENLYIA